MTARIEELPAGLYLVATPIGNARDITLRGLDLLASADVLVAEDTRTLRHLMQIHTIAVGGRPLVAYHDHSKPEVRERLMRYISEGRSVVYCSEAGMPMVADPGFQLVRAAQEAEHLVTCAPGASALTTSIALAGLPTDRFLFAGFPPNAKGAREKWLNSLAQADATVVIYTTATRVRGILAELVQSFGGMRSAALCRELTKRFEEVRRGRLDGLLDDVSQAPPRGEIVLVIDRKREESNAGGLDAALRQALREMSVKDAAGFVAEGLGLPRRKVYQRALELGAER